MQKREQAKHYKIITSCVFAIKNGIGLDLHTYLNHTIGMTNSEANVSWDEVGMILYQELDSLYDET